MNDGTPHSALQDGLAVDRPPQTEWQKLIEVVHERDENRCVNCSSTNRLEVHHIVPVSTGGEHRASNLVTLCRSCHLAAENKRERNDHVTLKSQKSYQYVYTPDDVRSTLRDIHHPVIRAMVALHSYYGVGVGEVCGIRVQDYTTSYPGVATEFEIERSDSPTLEIDPDREYTSTRTRAELTTFPLIPAVEAELVRALSIRPDPRSERGLLFLNTTEQWGKPPTRDAVTHQFHRHTSTRAQAFINCFKRYAPIDQHTKRYLLSGDSDEFANTLSSNDSDIDLEALVRSRYRDGIYELFTTGR